MKPMMRKKNNLVIGLTTFNTEMLKISISALSKIREKFILIIHNDNPMTVVEKRLIRKLGYCGDLHIINSNETNGELIAKINIIEAAKKFNPEWLMFCNDDDLLIELEIPNVSKNNFAIIQNAVVLRHRISNLLRVMDCTTDFDIDGEDIELLRPNRGFIGTPIRANVLFGLGKILTGMIEDIKNLNEKLDFYPPINTMLWNFVNIYARHINSEAAPIYMDKINYIKNDIDTSRIKYGVLRRPARNVEEQYQRILSKYNSLLQNLLAANAALRG